MPRPKPAIPTRTVCARLPVPKVEWLEAQAQRREISVTAFVGLLIERAGGPVEGEGGTVPQQHPPAQAPSRPEPCSHPKDKQRKINGVGQWCDACNGPVH